MSRDDIIRMAREAGFQTGVIHGADGSPIQTLVQHIGHSCIVELERFYALAVAKEREARQQAQREAEALRERIVKSGLELHRAVRDAAKEEREACAQLVEGASMRASFIRAGMNGEGIKPCTTAAAIRARKETK